MLTMCCSSLQNVIQCKKQVSEPVHNPDSSCCFNGRNDPCPWTCFLSIGLNEHIVLDCDTKRTLVRMGFRLSIEWLTAVLFWVSFFRTTVTVGGFSVMNSICRSLKPFTLNWQQKLLYTTRKTCRLWVLHARHMTHMNMLHAKQSLLHINRWIWRHNTDVTFRWRNNTWYIKGWYEIMCLCESCFLVLFGCFVVL